MSEQTLEIKTDDGQTIVATAYDAQEPSVEMTVVIAGELGYTQSHYAPFARFLAEQGLHVLTFDYRLMGASTAALKQAAPRLIDLGRLDLASVIEQVRHNKQDHKIGLVGHGVGGVLAGLATNNHQAAALLCVAVSTGYIRRWPMWLRPLSWVLYKYVIPFQAQLRERAALKELGPEKIPSSVLRDWADWCRHPNAPVNTFGVPQHRHFEAWRKPIRCYSFSDDGLATPKAVHTLAARYVNAPLELVTCTPESLGLESIGHDGFFSQPAITQLWEESAKWLQRFVPADLREEIEEV